LTSGIDTKAKMAEEKKDSWLNYLALETVILAVCATLSTLKGRLTPPARF